MLEAKKSVLFEKIFAVYNKNLLKRKFSSLRVSGFENLSKKDSSLPFLIFANHSSWWDGLVAFQISRELGLDSFVMMEEKQLKNLPLFRKLGAFSIVREKPREASESIRYAVKLLKADSQVTLWIFPQGEILPNDLRPLKFFNGLAHIVEKVEKCAVVPLAMRFEFLGKFKPEIFVRIGEPKFFAYEKDFSAKTATEIFVGKLAETLDELKNDVIARNFDDYRNIL